MWTALTRGVSPAIGACELEYVSREPIDAEKAARQHREYEECLASLGVRVISLPVEPDLPDSVFVEDPAVVLDEIAVIARMGAESRRRESESLAAALAEFRPIERLREPATLEGGDVLRVDRTLYVGISRRTNREGAVQLAELLDEFGYRVVPVQIRECLHLKSACSYLGDHLVLANRKCIDAAAFRDFEIIDVAKEEPAAANVLKSGQTLVMPSSFPRTREVLKDFDVRTVDVSELQKAEAGVTCTSIVFE
jgi:dimethylargininase